MTEEISVGYQDIFKIRSAFDGDFRYDNFNVGGLRFLIELFIFVNVRKEGGITSRFLFFKAIFAYLATLELPKQGTPTRIPRAP